MDFVAYSCRPKFWGVVEIALQKSGLGQIDVYLMLLCHRDLFSR